MLQILSLFHTLRNNVLHESCTILWERTEQARCEEVKDSSDCQCPDVFVLNKVLYLQGGSEGEDGCTGFWLL